MTIKTKFKIAKKEKSVVQSQHSLQISLRGRIFEGTVVKKFPLRVVVEFERTIYVYKYERFYQKKTRLHVRLPANFDVQIGDRVRVQECRPLSKIIHHVVIAKVSLGELKNESD